MTESELLFELQLEAKKLVHWDYGEFGGFKSVDEVSNETLIYMQILIDSIIARRCEKIGDC